MTYVLFVCTHDAGRSRMAQAFFERHTLDDVRVQELVERRLDLIRSGRTAQQLRLGSLLPGLVEEFGDRYDDAETRTAADAALAEFHDALVPSLVMTHAHRSVRELLRRGAPAPTP